MLLHIGGNDIMRTAALQQAALAIDPLLTRLKQLGRRVVWVDALVPARSGVTEPDADIRARIAPMVRDGRIADWTTWWGADAMTELVPDAALRAAIRSEGHELPADFYEIAVPVPSDWPEDGARYVQLSPAYDDAAAEARARGWRVVGNAGGSHLDVATEPARVADLLD